MPYAIDEDKLNDPSMQIMDPAKPPVKQIPYQPFPKMVYLHPKDKTKEHLTLVAHDQDELDKATAQGYRIKPHVPEVSSSLIPAGFEADIPEPAVEKRGPGRPPKVEAA